MTACAAAAGAAAGGAASAGREMALLAYGPMAVVDPSTFIRLLKLEEEPLVVEAEEKRGILSRKTVYVYIAGIRGLYFITESWDRLALGSTRVVRASKLVLPYAVRESLANVARS